LTNLVWILLLAVGLSALGFVAAWRHGASRRAENDATRYRDMADRFEQQANFIRTLTDSQPNAIFIVDRNDRLTFVNARLAQIVGVRDTDELVGKTLAGVFGPTAARRYARCVRDAFDEESNHLSVDRIARPDRAGQASEDRVLQTQFVYLPTSDHAGAGVLIVEQDISAAIAERERNERLLQQLVDTLLAIVDRRDPYAAHQSARVAQVASAIAEEMGLDPVLVDTVDKAASLMNVGKILVPRALLVKNGKLTVDEIDRIRHALCAGVELLEGVEFTGPVVETLRQTRAHVNGSGEPAGLADDEILVTARIVAVANAFVGMVSPRAHRPGMTFDAAIQNLLDGAGAQFDLGVVGALINRLDNRGGRSNWSNFSVPPPGIHGIVG
jgi:PAS domain S-box-containing protein